MVQSHVSANIRAEMARRGKTQADVAAVLGKRRQQVSQRLLGRVPFRLDELQTIAELLDVPLGSLFNETQVAS